MGTTAGEFNHKIESEHIHSNKEGIQDNDQIELKLNSQVNTRVIAVITEKYYHCNPREVQMTDGTTIIANNPQNVYLIILGTSEEGGNFQFTYRHIKNKEPKIIE